MSEVSEHRLHTVDEVALILRIHFHTVKKLIRENKMGHVRVGRNYRVTPSQLADYIERNTK